MTMSCRVVLRFLLVVAVGICTADSFGPLPLHHGKLNRAPLTQRSSAMKMTPTYLSLLRGGAQPSFVMPASRLFVGWSLVQGVLLAFFPKLGGSKLLGVNVEKHSFEEYLVEGMGIASLGHGITAFLALHCENMSPQKEIGYGLLVRIAFFLKTLVLDPSDRDIPKSRFLKINTGIMSWATTSLLVPGFGKPFIASRIFSATSLVKSTFLFLDPVRGAKKFLERDLKNDTEIALCKSIGEQLFVAATFMGCLAFNLGARAKVATSAVWSVLMTCQAFRSKNSTKEERNRIRLSLVVAVLCTAGFLT